MGIKLKLIIFCGAVAVLIDPIKSCNSKDKYKDTYKKCETEDCLGKSACVTIYEDPDFSGWKQCLNFDQTECIKFNDWWADGRVSSVNTHNTSCIRLYEYNDCTGAAVDISPDDPNQSDLRNLYFNNFAKSASFCGRNLDKGDDCYIKNVFYENLNPDEFSNAAGELLGTMDQVTELVTSGIAVVVPGIDLFYNGLKFVTGMFNQGDSTEELIDQKITKALGQNAGSQVSAKIAVIEKKVRSVLSEESNLKLKESEISIALASCEEIYALFLDKNYSFRKNVLISSPHLVVFSSVYLAVAKIAYKLLPSKRRELGNDMKQLNELIIIYKEKGIEERGKKFGVYDVCYSHCTNDKIIDKGFFGNEVQIRECGYTRCWPCLKMIRASIKVEIEQYFGGITEKVEQFP